ncbi:MAG: VWA domain-containing protein [Anaerolineae bacterium]
MAPILSLTMTPGRGVLPPTSQTQLLYVLLDLVPGLNVANVRMPLNVALVLDRSGSMIVDGKIKRLREAVRFLIDQFEPQDTLSIITFIKTAEMVMPAQRVQDREAIKRKVDRIDTDSIPDWYIPTMMKLPSETDALPALQAGIREVKKGQSAGRLSRMLVLTDGQLMHPEQVIQAGQQAGAAGIPIIALGIGTDWNDELLQSLGGASGGYVDYIAQPQQIEQVFRVALASLQATIVQNAVLTLQPSTGVELRKVWRASPLIADLGNSTRQVLGEIEKNVGQMLLVELAVHPHHAGRYRVLLAKVVYDVPAIKLSGEQIQAEVLVGFDMNAGQLPVSPKVMNVAERVTAFRLETRALEEIQSGNISGATEKLQSAANILQNQGEQDLARTLRLEADNLQQSGQMSADGTKTIKFKGGQTRRLD